MCLVTDDKPADIYRVVAEKTIRKLEVLADQKRNSCEISQADDEGPTDAQLAQWWLDYGLNRKVCKRNCMTFPYGSKQRGFSVQHQVHHRYS